MRFLQVVKVGNARAEQNRAERSLARSYKRLVKKVGLFIFQLFD